MQDPSYSFFYSPTTVGFDNTFWRSTSGNPTVASDRIRLNQDTAYSYPQFRFGIFEFGVIIPVAPTAGDDRKWGFKIPELGNKGTIFFQISGTTLSAVSYDNDGVESDSQDIPWDASWTNTETRFTINWSPKGVRISINGVDPIVLKVPNNIGDLPMALYLDNQNADDMDITYILVKESQSAIDPRTIGVGLSGEFQHDADSWTQAIAANADIAATRADLFSNVPLARHVQMTVSGTITVRFNSVTSPAITIRPNTRARWNNVYVTNMYVTAAADTDIDVYLQANAE